MSSAEITQEFRVVRDNRMNQNTAKDIMLGSFQNSTSENHRGMSNVQNKRYTIIFLYTVYYMLPIIYDFLCFVVLAMSALVICSLLLTF